MSKFRAIVVAYACLLFLVASEIFAQDSRCHIRQEGF